MTFLIRQTVTKFDFVVCLLLLAYDVYSRTRLRSTVTQTATKWHVTRIKQ